MRIAAMLASVLFVLAVLASLIPLVAVAQPGDYSSLTAEARARYFNEEYTQALELYRKAFAIGKPGLADLRYAAFCAAQEGQTDQAFAYLEEGVPAGMAGSEWLEQLERDRELARLRPDPRWKNLQAAMLKRGVEIESSFPEARAEGTLIDLPAPVLKGSVSVEEALHNRRSIRVYADTTLALAEVSQILWAAYGITEPAGDGHDHHRGGLRTAPSAGACYPLEIYLVARRVDGLAPGVYWYKSETHQLMSTPGGDRWDGLADATLGQGHFKTAAAAIVYSAIYGRTTSVYGERGRERYVCMDLGHSGENVYLEAYALGIGTCAVGSFMDLNVKQVIGMTRPEEPLYIMPLGRMRSNE
ncbi:MAG TPA: SagB/ThcOx family dehydrogenase [bacterium]|nr:SagB/ThcOx family dehydrogenase [bacterium]